MKRSFLRESPQRTSGRQTEETALHWRCHRRGRCTACADPFSATSSLRPSTRQPGGQPCSARLSPASRSWPWPSLAMGPCTQLVIVTLMRISSVPPARTPITTRSTRSMRQPEPLPVWVQLAPRNFSWTWRLIVKGACSVSRAPSTLLRYLRSCTASTLRPARQRLSSISWAVTPLWGWFLAGRANCMQAISLQTRVSIESTSKQVLRQPSPLCLLAFQAASSWRTHRSHSNDPPQTSHRHGHHCLCRHHRLLGHNGSEAARTGGGASRGHTRAARGAHHRGGDQIGKASGRGRGEILGGAVSLKKKTNTARTSGSNLSLK